MHTLQSHKHIPNTSGVYVLTAPSSNQYVGSSINIKNRVAHHKSRLQNNKHENARLQAAFNKHADFSLQFCTVQREHILEVEQLIYDMLNPRYNQCAVIAAPSQDPEIQKRIIASKTTDSARAKTAEQMRIRWEDTEYRARMTAMAQEVNADPAVHAARLATRIERNTSNKTRAQRSFLATAVNACPERREQHRKNTTALWGEEDYRVKTSAAIKAAQNKPETLEKRSAISKALWSDSEFKNKTRAKINASLQTQENRDKARARGTKAFASATPEEKTRWLNQLTVAAQSRNKKVTNLTTGVEYESVKAAAASVSRTHSSISIAIKTKGTAAGFKWQYSKETT